MVVATAVSPRVPVRVLNVGLWTGAVIGVLGLAVRRFRDGAAAGAYRLDLQTYFLPAARAVADGRSPYEVDGYLYSPLPAMLLAPLADSPAVLTVWTAVNTVSCLVAVLAFTVAFAPELPGWCRPVLAGLVGGTLLWNWPLTIEFELGNTDTQVLAVLALATWATRRRPAAAAALLVVAGLIKTWPLAIGLWLLRSPAGRGWRVRRRPLLVAVGAGLGAVAVFVVVFGPAVLRQWMTALTATQDYPWLTFSVWGVGRHLFAVSTSFPPLVVSPTLAGISTGLATAGVLALLAVVLRRPGDGRLALWHVTCCIVLLLPISHLEYLLLALPLLWIRAARVLAPADRRRGEVVLLVALLGWWWLTFRHVWPSDLAELHTATGYLTVLGSFVVVLTASVLMEARRSDGLSPRS